MFMKLLFTTVLSLVFLNISAQKLESYEFLEGRSALEIKFQLNNIITVPYGVDFYKIRYFTADINGDQHVASGLLCVPQDDTGLIFPMACYQHGTVAGRDDVPSNLAGGYTLPMVFSSYGYVVCAPDFIGLGDSPGIHPYVHAETEASAGVDLMLAARELAEELEELDINDQVFISGYSQGGHAAMALHREIEMNQTQQFDVTASAPMSGPYSISDKMIDFTLGDSDYETVSYIAWVTLSYQLAYPDLFAGITLEDVFLPEYLEDINLFKDEMIDLWELNDRMTATLISTVGSVTPKNTVKPEIVDAIMNDPSHPFSQALADNDVYDWAPNSPTKMYYCKGDDQVTYENALLAEEIMIANGAQDVEAVRRDNDVALLDHGGCVFPASIAAIEWFNTFQNIISSTGEIIDNDHVTVRYHNDLLYVNVADDSFVNGQVNIFNMSGQLEMQLNITDQSSQHDINALTKGFYLASIKNQKGQLMSSKFVKY